MNLNLRHASKAPFPYGWPDIIAYAVVREDGSVEQIRHRQPMRDAVREALAGNVTLIAAWPGEYRTDLFVIDEPEKLATAIGVSQQ